MAGAIVWSVTARDGRLSSRTYVAALIGPTVAVYLATRYIVTNLSTMAATGTGGLGTVAATFYEAVMCVEVALVVSWVITFVVALFLSRARFPMAGDSTATVLVPVGASFLAAIPIAILAALIQHVIGIANPNAAMNADLSAASARTTALVLASSWSAIIAANVLLLGCVLATLCRRPTRRVALATVWCGQAVLGAVVVAVFLWAQRLYQIAAQGSL